MAGTSAATRAAWERRGRIKQAACLALGCIGQPEPRVLECLHRYATDQGQDYAVRAAACKALGLIHSPLSRPIVEQATADLEWCTKTEAQKAVQRIG